MIRLMVVGLNAGTAAAGRLLKSLVKLGAGAGAAGRLLKFV